MGFGAFQRHVAWAKRAVEVKAVGHLKTRVYSAVGFGLK
jgi:hypothetical protein